MFLHSTMNASSGDPIYPPLVVQRGFDVTAKGLFASFLASPSLSWRFCRRLSAGIDGRKADHRGGLPSPLGCLRQLPFSFVYGGRPSSELIGKWKRTVEEKTIDATKARRTVTLNDPETGLEVAGRLSRSTRHAGRRLDTALHQSRRQGYADPRAGRRGGRGVPSPQAGGQRGPPPSQRMTVSGGRLAAIRPATRCGPADRASPQPAAGRPTSAPCSMSSGTAAASSRPSAGPASGPPRSSADKEGACACRRACRTCT